jgi:hypothetical protein
MVSSILRWSTLVLNPASVYISEPKESLTIFDISNPISQMTLKLQHLMLHVSADVVYLAVMRSLALPVHRLKYLLTRASGNSSKFSLSLDQETWVSNRSSEQPHRCCPIAK